MTRDQAIIQIKWYFEEDDGVAAEDITKEAINIAIEALTRSVDVVRCKDCKWAVPYQMENGSVRLHCNESDLTGIHPDDYCSFGERKEK